MNWRHTMSRMATWPRRYRLLMAAGVFLCIVAVLVVWWQRQATRPALVIAGAAQLQPLLTALGQGFAGMRYRVQVEGGGSAAALLALRRGAIDLAMLNQVRPGMTDEAQTGLLLLGRNSISFIVNRALPLRDVSQQAIRDVLSGKHHNWQALGGPDAPIRLLSRSKPSPTRQFVDEVVLQYQPASPLAKTLDSAEEMVAAVERDPLAIGYVSLQEMNFRTPVVQLRVDGVPFSRATILSGRYPYSQDLYLAYHNQPSPAAANLLAYIRSPAAQELIEHYKLISVY